MAPEELMESVTRAFGKADLRPLFEALHHEIIWRPASGPNGPFRFSGEFHSVVGVQEVLSKLFTRYVFKRLDAREIVAKGETVWGLFDAEVDCLPLTDDGQPPRRIPFEIAIRWRLKDGKIIEHRGFFDTASFLARQNATLDAAQTR
jgi:hypothetical protein